jgi:GTP-binding protein
MALPRIAIIGRPNVGKSSLLNRLARRRVSIVDPAPGVTRDRVTTLIELPSVDKTESPEEPRLVELIDTGGWGVYAAEGRRFNEIGEDLASLTGEIEQQIQAAIEQADVVLFVTDAQSGLTALDRTIAEMLRRHGRADRVILLANKVDDERRLAGAAEASALGFGEPLAVSATTGRGVKTLLAMLAGRVGRSAEPAPQQEMKIAIVGKRNAGKSSLINALAGEQRVIVSEIAGTTRDSIDVRFQISGRSMLAIDTAGLRKRKSIADDVEFYAMTRMREAVRRADVAVLLLDATATVSQVDQTLAQELQTLYKPTVIAVNKWDLVEDRLTPEDYQEYLTQQLRGLEFAPIAFLSAKDGHGVREVVAMAFNLFEQARHRETTGRLNAAIRKILKKRGPTSRLGTQARLLYVSQVEVCPPTIVMVVNDPKLFAGTYERYLLNELREVVPYSEVPIRLIFTQRKRMGLEEMKARGKMRSRSRA